MLIGGHTDAIYSHMTLVLSFSLNYYVDVQKFYPTHANARQYHLSRGDISLLMCCQTAFINLVLL